MIKKSIFLGVFISSILNAGYLDKSLYENDKEFQNYRRLMIYLKSNDFLKDMDKETRRLNSTLPKKVSDDIILSSAEFEPLEKHFLYTYKVKLKDKTKEEAKKTLLNFKSNFINNLCFGGMSKYILRNKFLYTYRFVFPKQRYKDKFDITYDDCPVKDIRVEIKSPKGTFSNY